MKKKNVKIQRSETGNHRAQSFVERANKTLGQKHFSHQYAQEMIQEGRSRVWLRKLPKSIEVLNSRVTRLTGMKAIEAYNEENVELKPKVYSRPVGFQEKILENFEKVRYLLSPGVEEGGNIRRATDPFWSIKVYDLEKSLVFKYQCVLYFLADGLKRGFVREELQIVPENTELPPSFVLK